MKNIRLLKIFVITLFAIFISCDKITEPLKENSGQCGDENLPIPIRKVLIEDYTGHLCNNCPDAAAKIEELKELYCDHIIPIGVHAGYFARTTTEYPEDFRTEAGEEFLTTFEVQAFPSGMVNRSIYNDVLVMNYSNWASAIDTLLTFAPEIDINIVNEYKSENRVLNITVNSNGLLSINESISLSVFFVEDSIIAPQLTASGKVENYIHRHVLRKAVNGTWGEVISTSGLNKGDQIVKTYNITLSEDWDENHGEVIAFIYKTNSTSKEIIQAESEHILSQSAKK